MLTCLYWYLGYRTYLPVTVSTSYIRSVAVSFVFLKPTKGSEVSPAWNIFMWVTIIIGSGLLMVLYCLEWYAVQDNPKNNVSKMVYIQECTEKVVLIK